MVDVTRCNFVDAFKQIKKEIAQCSFIAIDAEFTGLLTGQERDSLYDTPAERYARHRDLGSEFIINQFGICLTEETAEGFTAKPYNFYLYPVERSNIPQRDDAWFTCQASSLKMLSQSGFDFNKWIREGIQYVSESRAQQKQLQSPGWKAPPSPAVPSPASGIAHETPSPQSPVKKLRLMARSGEQESFIEQARRDLLTFTHNPDTRELKVMTHSRFERKVVYTLIEEDPAISKTPLTAEKTVDEGRDVEMVVKKISQDAQELNMKERADKQKAREELKLGFTSVIQLLSDCGKPLVLHNGLLDLMNLFRQFIGPLPEQFDQFKQAVLARFPHIVDTKLLASSPPISLPRTRLADIFNSCVSSSTSLLERVAVRLPEEFGRYGDDGDKKCHEAGYDAYMTTVCFAHMFHHMRKLAGPRGGEETDGPLDPMRAVAPFRNRLAMGFCDVEYIDFHGPDPLPPRDNVFHLSFPAATRASDIVELFGVYGPVDIRWIDDRHAFVSLKPEKKAEECLRYLRSDTRDSEVEVQRYRDYRTDLYGTGTGTAPATTGSTAPPVSVSTTSTSTSTSTSSSTSQQSSGNGKRRKRQAARDSELLAKRSADVAEQEDPPATEVLDSCLDQEGNQTKGLFPEPKDW